MSIDFLEQFFASPVGSATILVIVAAVADFAFGIFGALRDNVFQMDAVAAWVRKHLWGRVAPILSVLLIGAATGGISIDDGLSGVLSPGGVFTGVGILAATTYILEIVASIRESLTPSAVREVPEE